VSTLRQRFGAKGRIHVYNPTTLRLTRTVRKVRHRITCPIKDGFEDLLFGAVSL
jgi:hypothetical protein